MSFVARGKGREREREALGSYEHLSGRVVQLSDLMSESKGRLFNIVVEAQEHMEEESLRMMMSRERLGV